MALKGRAYIGIDIGTTSVKCLAVDDTGRVCASASGAYPSYAPRPGWVEQEPEEWMHAVYPALRSCIKALSGYEIRAVSFSGHMSSPVFLDAENAPVCRCITISDIRSEKQTERLTRDFAADFERACGNRPLDCFAASKLLWLKEGRPELYAKTRKFVFAKDYVRGRLTGVYNTEPTDAGNSLLYDFTQNRWDESLISRIGLDAAIFPEVAPSTKVTGCITAEAAGLCGLPEGTPVVCGAADMACSQLGTGALRDGLLVITLSTSGQLCMRVPSVMKEGIGRLTFHRGAAENSLYAMASVFSGGLSINWTYQTLFDKAAMAEKDYEALLAMSADIARVPPGADGVSFLPYLTGSGSPYFDPRDRAVFAGLSLGAAKPRLLRAAMEGVAYNIRENLDAFEGMGAPVLGVRLGGGGAKIPAWRSIIADVLGRDIPMLEVTDASAAGACILARVCDRGADAITAMSEEMVKCTNVIGYNKENSMRYDKLFEQYKALRGFMNIWQRAQADILG